MSKKEETTNVAQIDLDLNDILGTGVDSIMLSDEGAKVENEKPSIFSRNTTDTSFLDKPIVSDTDTDDDAADDAAGDDDSGEKAPKLTQKDVNEALSFEDDENDDDDFSDDVNSKNKGGRPTALVTAAKKLIEKGLLTPFVDDKGQEEDITNYTAEDFEELISANLQNYQESTSNQVAGQFFESLPQELQYAAKYVMDGGTDMKGMFKALAQAQEVRDTDISTESGQKYAIRAYLTATNYGTPEEIEDEIYSLEDRGELEKKANQFKPKLDKMQEEIVAQRVARQEAEAKQRAAQSQKYIDTVYSTLEKGELNGLKLDEKTQNMLYAGLVQSNYPSMSGRQTNMLGHLLEKYQWQEPRHDLIAEALWLLADPDGYKNNVAKRTEQEVNQKTLRTLKTEQSTKSSSSMEVDNDNSGRRVTRGVQRPKRNFFGR